ncbi:hypothetical protein [Streptomyces sp. NPDC001275]
MRDAVAAHPAIVPLAISHRRHSLGVLRWSDAALAVLTEAGVAGERRVVACADCSVTSSGPSSSNISGPVRSGHRGHHRAAARRVPAHGGDHPGRAPSVPTAIEPCPPRNTPCPVLAGPLGRGRV